MKHYSFSYIMAVALLMLSVMLAGCQFSQSSFSRTVSNTGSAFAAAATTLQYAHEGKLTYAYASSSFEVYRSELSGTDQQLTSSGAGAQSIAPLLSVYRTAMQAVNTPCLQDTCNWQAQVAALSRASQAFLKAGNS